MPGITALTTGALTVLLTALSLHVSRLRLRHRISFGHGAHKDLEAAIRAHGNTLEQSLLFVLLLLLLELLRPGASWLGWPAAAFVLVRVTHGAALFMRRLPVRQAAHVATLLLQLGLAAALLKAAW